jgi:Na+/proline symporter
MSFFMILAGLACLLGALMQWAVHRSPDVVDSRKSVTMARRITIVALLVAALYIFGGDPSTVTCLILGLIGLGQMLYAAHNLKLDLTDGTHA